MTEKDFIVPASSFASGISGTVRAKSPSNIALVKYWGKISPQIPNNPSISYTLTASFTQTELFFRPKAGETSHIEIFFESKPKPEFLPKIQKFFNRISAYAPYLSAYDFRINTQNSFPHSSGIASSASGMSALAKCLIQMEAMLGYSSTNADRRASFLARLGSGSACRSVYSGLVAWGKSKFLNDSSDLYAVPVDTEIHPVFKNFRDTILLIHEGAKSVSSTVGHALMENHSYAENRFEQARKNTGKLLDILKSGNVEDFGALVEHEALSLHALMMMSNPPYILMMPETVAAINKIWDFRKENNLPLYFTLDAGANVHLLYPETESEYIQNFIENELLPLCQNEKAIYDRVNFDVV